MLKRALLVGINQYADSPLLGCVHDVDRMYEILVGTFGFKPTNIRVLRDNEATRRAIQDNLDWLVSDGGAAGAVRVFHYAGHGSQVEDLDHDEPDGADECLVPIDEHEAGVLTDDQLSEIYARVPQGDNLTLLMDCCFSGTAQRAPEGRYRTIPPPEAERQAIERARLAYREEHILSKLREQGVSPSEIGQAAVRAERLLFEKQVRDYGDVQNRENNLLLAACRSDQRATDTMIEGANQGVFSHYLVKAIEALGPGATCLQIAAKVAPELKRFKQTLQIEGPAASKERPFLAPFGA